jgi:hypothetical protein
VWWLYLLDLSYWGASTPPFISKGRGYKEGNRVTYNMIPIRTLSLLAYFTDIAIYALGSMPWSSRIFWMVGRVVLDPSLGYLSPCGGTSGTNPRHSIYALYPQRKKVAFKIYRVGPQIIRGVMSHNTGFSLDLSDCLLTAQREIHYLCTRLADTEHTLRACEMMQASQDNDIYSSDQDTWAATSPGVGTGEELLLDSLLPSGSYTH